MAGDHTADRTAAWSAIAPVAAGCFLLAKIAGLVGIGHPIPLLLAALLLGGAVFAAVHHAEILALKLGEPFGSILLAISVTVIECALIISILLANMAGSGEVARDTVYATVMIVLNGIVGLCLVAGGWRHREQTFRVDGAAATLAVLGTLATFTLILPNFTEATVDPTYAPTQLLVVGGASLALYVLFVVVQAVRHREYFLESGDADKPSAIVPTTAVVAASSLLLIVSLVAVVVLAKTLSKPLEGAIAAAGLPSAVLGVAIAVVVLLPEGIAAFRAALDNRLQTSINLALGSAVATIGLTIPVVAAVSLATGKTLILGVSPENMVLLFLTLFAATLTLGTGRTTVLQGGVHLVIFSVFLLLTALP